MWLYGSPDNPAAGWSYSTWFIELQVDAVSESLGLTVPVEASKYVASLNSGCC